MDAAIWVQTIGTVTTIGAGALGIWWQVRRQWLTHSAALLVSLEEQFRSPELITARKELARVIQEESQKTREGLSLTGYWPALSFFDGLGVMVRRRAVDEEMVWSRFGWRITRCYIALKEGSGLLERTRSAYDEPAMYEQFEWLAKRMLKRRRSKNKLTLDATKATKEYVDQELALTYGENLPLLPPKENRLLSLSSNLVEANQQSKKKKGTSQ